MKLMDVARLRELKIVASTPLPVPGRSTKQHVRGDYAPERFVPEPEEKEWVTEKRKQAFGNISEPGLRGYILWLERERIRLCVELAEYGDVCEGLRKLEAEHHRRCRLFLLSVMGDEEVDEELAGQS